jgi:hypothetical protein
MKFKQGVVVLVWCVVSGMTLAAAPEAGGKAGKGAKLDSMSKAMQEMVGKACEEFSAARGDDGSELECVKGKWRVEELAQDGSPKKAKMRPVVKVCIFTCSTSHGIEVCKGNGSQCNGKSPW